MLATELLNRIVQRLSVYNPRCGLCGGGRGRRRRKTNDESVAVGEKDVKKVGERKWAVVCSQHCCEELTHSPFIYCDH